MATKTTGFRAISDDVVKKRTGKPSQEWYRLLDEWNASQKGHTETAKHLREQHQLSDWWCQAVAIRYEWERGLRR